MLKPDAAFAATLLQKESLVLSFKLNGSAAGNSAPGSKQHLTRKKVSLNDPATAISSLPDVS
jgi:hypothetical protein